MIVAVDKVYIMAALSEKDKRIAYAIIRHLQSQVDSRAVTGEAAEGVSGKNIYLYSQKKKNYICGLNLVGQY